ncbi:MAG: DMT family transporter [Rhodospirillales bacterium]|nr:DMT family transporter [Rhodospirillales bacterium]
MSGVIQNPVFLLLITGTLIGFNFPLGKIASDAGVSPMVWAMIISLSVSAMLLPYLAAKRRLSAPRGRTARYVVVSGLISFVAPNVLLFSVIPHVGSGFTGLMFALSPVFTLSLAGMYRLKGPNRIGIFGIALGLAGAAVVAVTRGAGPEAPPIIWIVSALLIPLALACGNVYRTLDWPDDASPDSLAFWSHSFSGVIILLLLVFTNGTLPLNELMHAPWAALAQGLVAGVAFPVFFRLQRYGGPVLLSQIGYVAAAIGLIAATVFLGESYSFMTWIGATVIAVGIAATVLSQIMDI